MVCASGVKDDDDIGFGGDIENPIKIKTAEIIGRQLRGHLVFLTLTQEKINFNDQ
jgi:hypothetical protein